MNDTTVVIGAGITGLSAAHALKRAGRTVSVLEASDRVGGRMVRLKRGGDAAEAGAQGIHTNYREMLGLIDTYGLRSDLMPQHNERAAFLDRQGAVQVPHGHWGMLRMMGVRGTVDFMRFTARYMARGEKFDLFETQRDIPHYDDVSASDALSWAGPDFRDFFLRPSSDAMCNTTLEYTNLYHFLNLIKLVAATKVCTLRGGNVTLAERIAEQVPVTLGSAVSRLLTSGGRVDGVLLEDGRTLKARHVIIACPMNRAAALMPDSCPEAAAFASSFRNAPFVLVYFFLDRPLPAPAFVYFGHAYRNAAFNMAIHHTEKTPHLVPSGKAIISAWTSYPASARLITQPDDAVVRQALQDLEAFFPRMSKWVEGVHVQRHDWGVARLGPGQHAKILDFKHRIEGLRGVSVASNDLDGVHMESGVRAGLRAAHRALTELA
jgi:protoporphyrinogen oxidase